jgi:hypothetical protein
MCYIRLINATFDYLPLVNLGVHIGNAISSGVLSLCEVRWKRIWMSVVNHKHHVTQSDKFIPN